MLTPRTIEWHDDATGVMTTMPRCDALATLVAGPPQNAAHLVAVPPPLLADGGRLRLFRDPIVVVSGFVATPTSSTQPRARRLGAWNVRTRAWASELVDYETLYVDQHAVHWWCLANPPRVFRTLRVREGGRIHITTHSLPAAVPRIIGRFAYDRQRKCVAIHDCFSGRWTVWGEEASGDGGAARPLLSFVGKHCDVRFHPWHECLVVCRAIGERLLRWRVWLRATAA